MRQKNQMTVKGIGNAEGGRLYRDLEGNPDGILYYEDKGTGILLREVLEQDLPLVRQVRRVAASELLLLVEGKIVKGDKIIPPDTDRELRKLIEEKKEGELTLAAFNMFNGEFICIIEVEPLDAYCEEGAICLSFLKNKLIKNRYEEIIKKRFNEICIETGLFVAGCKEKIWRGTKPFLIPIP